MLLLLAVGDTSSTKDIDKKGGGRRMTERCRKRKRKREKRKEENLSR